MTLERNMIEFLAVSMCIDCQKLSYSSRKVARRATNWYTKHKTVYRCPIVHGLWHVGALPQAVLRGDIDRKEYYGNKQSGQAVDCPGKAAS